jgi:hypothetical protein
MFNLLSRVLLPVVPVERYGTKFHTPLLKQDSETTY